jgi:ubiquinone/menaquinone biosynthesis C-methylase UbiE
VADLTDAPIISAATFDCIICTQTLQFIEDYNAALRTMRRILKPGGTLLVTVPTISKIDKNPKNAAADRWRFTSSAVKSMFERAFGIANVTVTAHGNLLSAVCFLHGIAAEELILEKLDLFDPEYELLVCARAVKNKTPDEN